MEQGYIYSITNMITGKTYIGQTQHYERRRRSHISSLNRGVHHNDYLQNSWNKYGEDVFAFRVIEKCQVGELNKKEDYYIKKVSSMVDDGGYNLITGGAKYRKHSQYVRKKMSISGLGKKFTEEHKQKLSISHKGKKIKKETIRKIEETKRRNRSQWGEKNGNAILTDKQAENIIRDIYSGMGRYEIAEKHNVDENIFYRLKANTIYKHILPEIREELRNDYRNREKYNKVENMYREGMSQSGIAKELRISRNTIRNILIESNIGTALHKNQFTGVMLELEEAGEGGCHLTQKKQMMQSTSLPG